MILKIPLLLGLLVFVRRLLRTLTLSNRFKVGMSLLLGCYNTFLNLSGGLTKLRRITAVRTFQLCNVVF